MGPVPPSKCAPMLLRLTTFFTPVALIASAYFLPTEAMNSRMSAAPKFGGTMVYTASLPLKARIRKSVSSTEPTAASAPKASMAPTLSALLVITVTSCPAAISVSANGLLMFPKEPVNVIFIFLRICFLIVASKGIFVLTFIQVLTPKYVS